MKKLIFNITLTLVAMMVFTSCVQNNKKQQQTQQQTPKKVKLQYEYNMFCPSEILEFADIEITYADGDGTLITDTITAGQQEEDTESTVDFHTNISINSVPTRLYLTFRYLPKDGVSAGADKSVSTEATMYFSTVNSDQIFDYVQPYENPTKSVKASELKAYFDQFNANPPVFDYTLQEKSVGMMNTLGLVKNN